MKITKINISELKSNTGQIEGLPKNPRFIRDEKYKKLVQSIKDDPEMLELREVVAYDNSGELVVIMGNMRLRALKELGLKEVTCKILPFETDIEKLKAYTIKDNVGFGEHDFDALVNEWDADQLNEWGVDLPEFDNSELQDYSGKNKEIDTDDFSDKMEMKFELSSDEYQFIQSELSKIDANKELALLKLLNYES